MPGLSTGAVHLRSLRNLAESFESGWSPVLELRQYTLRPGRRDELVELFDDKFVESQEELGMSIVGQFRDLDRDDVFVWFRGFPDLATRAQRLTDFYHGPVWRAYSVQANATMLDASDVLLLRPAARGSAFDLAGAGRRCTQGGLGEGVVEAAIVYLQSTQLRQDAVEYFERHAIADVAARGGRVLGFFVSDPGPNEFPALPIREGEEVFVWVAGSSDPRSSRLCSHAAAALSEHLGSLRAPDVLRLQPTSRSLLTGVSNPCRAVTPALRDREQR